MFTYKNIENVLIYNSNGIVFTIEHKNNKDINK